MKSSFKKSVIRAIKIFCIPLGTLLCFQFLCIISGTSLFGIPEHFLSFVRTVAVVALTTYALSINLSSGRFDFSLGAVALLSSLVAAQISLYFHLPVICMLLFSAVTGILLGVISGGLYVLLHIPPIIISLGTTLMFESISYMEFIEKKLRAMDTTAITICMENKVPVLAFGLFEKDSLYRAVTGEKIGTLIK